MLKMMDIRRAQRKVGLLDKALMVNKINSQWQMARDKRAPREVKLPIPVRQRVAEVAAVKRSQEGDEDNQAKFVKFDPNTEIKEPSPKQQRTALYSPTYYGYVSGSPATSSSSARHVRRVVDELELYDEDDGSAVFQRNHGTGNSLRSLLIEGGRVEISEEDQTAT